MQISKPFGKWDKIIILLITINTIKQHDITFQSMFDSTFVSAFELWKSFVKLSNIIKWNVK